MNTRPYRLNAPPRMRMTSGWAPLAAVVLCGFMAPCVQGAVEEAQSVFKDATGICVAIGCDESHITELARNGNLLVHVLGADNSEVARLRKAIESKGSYGRVSVDCLKLPRLPYAENLIDLVVVGDWSKLASAGLAFKEVMRVMCPDGIAFLRTPSRKLNVESLKAGLNGLEVLKDEEGWTRIRKLRPGTMGDWSHMRQGADGNPVSKDRMDPPTHPRWLAGPTYRLGWSSARGIVSAGGRFFMLTGNPFYDDGGKRKLTARFRPQAYRFELTARNAYNGRRLWTVNLHEGKMGFGRYHHHPRVWRRLAADAERVFFIYKGKPTAFDARTGKVLHQYATFASKAYAMRQPPDILLVDQGVLYMVWELLGGAIRAVDVRTGSLLWKRDFSFKRQRVLIGDGRAFFIDQEKKELVCLDARTGKSLWSRDVSAWFPGDILLTHSGILVYRQSGKANAIHVVSVENGDPLWSKSGGKEFNANMTLIASGLVWTRESVINGRSKHLCWKGLDPKTGKATRSLDKLPGVYVTTHCFPHTATDRFHIGSIPTDFIDMKNGEVNRFRAGLNICSQNAIPANGLLYTTPAARLYTGAGTLEAIAAFAPRGPGEVKVVDDKARLEKGPAWGKRAGHAQVPEAGNGDWPMYRHNPQRTCGTTEAIPSDLKALWSVTVNDQQAPAPNMDADWTENALGGDKLTAPVIADGLVFVGLVESHRMVALDAKTGKERWRFTTGGRLDVPPTVHKGLCLFGSADGWVYCLKASDGALVWRFQAAPYDRRMAAFGQLESEWPVVGGVLVDQGLACFVVGRTTNVDGGVKVYALKPETGEVVWTSCPTFPAKSYAGFGNGMLSDLLVSDGSTVSISGSIEGQFELGTGKPFCDRVPYRMLKTYPFDRVGRKFAFNADSRFLDRYYQAVEEGIGHQYLGKIWANLLAYLPDEPERIYGHRHFNYDAVVHRKRKKNIDTRGELFLRKPDLESKPPLRWGYKDHNGLEISEAYYVQDAPLWSAQLVEGVRFNSLVLAGKHLVAARPLNYLARKKGEIRILSASDGKQIKVISLEDAPAAEGLAVASGRLYVSTRHGRLICFGKK